MDSVVRWQRTKSVQTEQKLPNLNRGNIQNQIVNGALETGGPRIKDPLFIYQSSDKGVEMSKCSSSDAKTA